MRKLLLLSRVTLKNWYVCLFWPTKNLLSQAGWQFSLQEWACNRFPKHSRWNSWSCGFHRPTAIFLLRLSHSLLSIAGTVVGVHGTARNAEHTGPLDVWVLQILELDLFFHTDSGFGFSFRLLILDLDFIFYTVYSLYCTMPVLYLTLTIPKPIVPTVHPPHPL